MVLSANISSLLGEAMSNLLNVSTEELLKKD